VSALQHGGAGTRTVTDQMVREGWEYCMADQARSWRDVESHCGVSPKMIRRRALVLGLPSSKHHLEASRMVYGRVLGDYRQGQNVARLAVAYELTPAAILGVLRDAGEVCARCGILLARNDGYGIAVLQTGERICQECVEEAGYAVVRWDVEPIR